ncbi:MAG TPA: class I SAM-dependent methyltransferase [Longimicrobiales bacterium]
MSLRQYMSAAAVAFRNVLLGGNLGAWRMVRRPRQLAEFASETRFLQRTFADRRGVPQRNVWDVIGGERTTSITLAHEHYWPWFGTIATYATDLVNLCVLCHLLRPTTVFEIGTAGGLTALHFALNSAADARIFTLDMPLDSGVVPALRTTLIDGWHIRGSAQAGGRHVFDDRPEADRIECLYGDSATFDFSPWRGAVDLFFIDGAHSYEYVRSDTARALECVRPGGVVAWHDFGRVGVNGVSRAVLELARAGREVYAVPGGSVAFMVAR